MHRHDPGDRSVVAGNQVFLAGRDLIDQRLEAHLGSLDADRLAHAAECSTQCATFKATLKRGYFPSRSSAALTAAGSTLIVTPARSFCRFMATRESRASQPRFSAEV